MEPINILPLALIVAVFLTYLVLKIMTCKWALDKETFTNDSEIWHQNQGGQQQQLQSPGGESITVQSPTTASSGSSLFTISGLISGRSPRFCESPPKYDMPPSYDEAIVYEKDGTTVVTVER